jgi:hypothetical protein
LRQTINGACLKAAEIAPYPPAESLIQPQAGAKLGHS